MALRRTRKGREWMPDPYPKPVEIPHHQWIWLELSLQKATSERDARERITNFCKTYNIDRAAVMQRMDEEIEAIEEKPKRTLH